LLSFTPKHDIGKGWLALSNAIVGREDLSEFKESTYLLTLLSASAVPVIVAVWAAKSTCRLVIFTLTGVSWFRKSTAGSRWPSVMKRIPSGLLQLVL